MNLLAARVVLRPRAVTEVLDLALPFCLASWRGLGWLGVAVLVPAFGLCVGARLALGWSWPAVWVLAVVLEDVVQGVFTIAHGRLLFEEPGAVSARGVLTWFLGRLPAYLLSLLLSRLALALAVLSVVLLPVVPMRLAYLREVLLLESAGPLAALRRSGSISERRLAATTGLLLALLTAPLVMLLGADLVAGAVVADLLQLGHPFGELSDGGTPYALAGFFLSAPVTSSARFLAYIDARTRKEGWDLQLRFMALTAGSGAVA